MINRSICITVSDPSRVGAARRHAAELCRVAGFGETKAGQVAIVATEAANNLCKHAKEGRIFLRVMGEEEGAGLEILTIDKGPGMADVAKCLRDGYSTAGSPGTGLGAMSRLANVFDVYSEPGKGTVLVVQFQADGKAGPGQRFRIGSICVPMHEGDACGDAWTSHCTATKAQFLVVDGLGHGPAAADAADKAIRAFHVQPGRSPAEMLRDLHGPLRSTRGASLAITELDLPARTVRYAGVGNISGTLVDSDTTRSMVSHNGIVGHEIHSVVEFTYPWQAARTLVLHSDGLQARWRLDAYPGLLARHPAIIAGVLYRDFQRGRDDVTVLVARQTEVPR